MSKKKQEYVLDHDGTPEGIKKALDEHIREFNMPIRQPYEEIIIPGNKILNADISAFAKMLLVISYGTEMPRDGSTVDDIIKAIGRRVPDGDFLSQEELSYVFDELRDNGFLREGK